MTSAQPGPPCLGLKILSFTQLKVYSYLPSELGGIPATSQA
jgi:hypothetical protein